MKNSNEMTEQEQIEYAKKCLWNIKWSFTKIKNPTEKTQLYVVNEDGTFIKDIIEILGKNPSKEVQKAAINNDYRSIQYIINPDEEIQRYVVKNDFRSIDYIKNPSLKLQKYVLYKNLHLIINYEIYKCAYIRKPKYKNLMKWID